MRTKSTAWYLLHPMVTNQLLHPVVTNQLHHKRDLYPLFKREIGRRKRAIGRKAPNSANWDNRQRLGNPPPPFRVHWSIGRLFRSCSRQKSNSMKTWKWFDRSSISHWHKFSMRVNWKRFFSIGTGWLMCRSSCTQRSARDLPVDWSDTVSLLFTRRGNRSNDRRSARICRFLRWSTGGIGKFGWIREESGISTVP